MSENPKEAAGRRKVALHLVPPALTIAVAGVMEHGASKYGPYNWRSAGITASIYTGAMLRHLLAFMDGQDLDPESGQPHLAAIAASCGIMLDAACLGMVRDDRPPPGPAAAMIEARTRAV